MSRSPSAPQAHFHMMAKPASYRCNLRCSYCFYLEKEEVVPQQAGARAAETMSDATLRRYVRDYIQSHAGEQVDFAWQGGEPMLAGLPFYQKAVEYQKKYADGKIITNSFQTNGIAINSQWADFFAEQQFLIGVSVDGLAAVHNRYRIAAQGQPTFDRVCRAIETLRHHQVEFNTLTVVNDQNWDKGRQTYEALKALGSTFMQFIPLVEVDVSIGCGQGRHYSPPASPTMAPFSVPAHGYGQFMSDVFDAWVTQDVGRYYVREFDSLLGVWMGYPASTCVQAATCGQALIIEASGDIYSCDHFVYPANRLGNIADTSLLKLATSARQQRFGQAKQDKLTTRCQQCPVRPLCHGGCPKHRLIGLPDERQRHNYLCPSYLHFFTHTAQAMQMMQAVIRRGGVAADVMPLLKHA